MATSHFARTVFKGGQGGAGQRVRYITRTESDRAARHVGYQGVVAGTGDQREDLVYWRSTQSAVVVQGGSGCLLSGR